MSVENDIERKKHSLINYKYLSTLVCVEIKFVVIISFALSTIKGLHNNFHPFWQ